MTNSSALPKADDALLTTPLAQFRFLLSQWEFFQHTDLTPMNDDKDHQERAERWAREQVQRWLDTRRTQHQEQDLEERATDAESDTP